MSVKGSRSTGTANKSNRAGWADYAKRNSYKCDNGELKDKLDANASGGPRGRENDWSKDDWKVPQQKSEGRGWAKPTSDLSDNTYTGKGGSKRD